MSIPRLNLTSHEPQFILSEDDRRGKLSQRGSPGPHSQKGDSYLSAHPVERLGGDDSQGLRSGPDDRFGDLGKAVVDTATGVMAIDGELHADEEALLLYGGLISIRNFPA
jgi:hypothetical protein